MTQLLSTLRRLFSQPDFVLAVVLLGAGAIGLNFATQFLKLHYHKEVVKLRLPWDAPDAIPPTMGKWVQVSVDSPLDPDTEHALGTDKYLYRDYVNRDLVGDPTIAELTDRNLSSTDRAVALSKVEAEHPNAIIHLGLTYYTGMVDTVPHIPDRCYIADGYDVSTYDIEKDQPFGTYADGTQRVVSFRYLHFDDDTGRGRISKNVAYLFHVNGHYEESPLGVRSSLQNLLERYGYFAKVELMTTSPATDRDSAQRTEYQQRALAAMKDFMGSLLPEVERCLPDWKKLHEQPASAAAAH